MDAAKIRDYATRLFAARGEQAIVEAAQKAALFERHGDNEQARTWRRIQGALSLIRGPRET